MAAQSHRDDAEVLRFDVEITKAEYTKLQLCLLMRPAGLASYALVTGAAASVVILAYRQGSIDLGAAWIWPLILVLFPINTVRAARRHYDANPFLSGPVTYQIGADGIHVRGASSEHDFAWAALHKLVEVPGWLLVFLNNASMLPLPLGQLDAATRQKLAVRLRQRLPGSAPLPIDVVEPPVRPRPRDETYATKPTGWSQLRLGALWIVVLVLLLLWMLRGD
jgi:hypothetical protein